MSYVWCVCVCVCVGVVVVVVLLWWLLVGVLCCVCVCVCVCVFVVLLGGLLFVFFLGGGRRAKIAFLLQFVCVPLRTKLSYRLFHFSPLSQILPELLKPSFSFILGLL